MDRLGMDILLKEIILFMLVQVRNLHLFLQDM